MQAKVGGKKGNGSPLRIFQGNKIAEDRSVQGADERNPRCTTAPDAVGDSLFHPIASAGSTASLPGMTVGLLESAELPPSFAWLARPCSRSVLPYRPPLPSHRALGHASQRFEKERALHTRISASPAPEGGQPLPSSPDRVTSSRSMNILQ